MPAAAIGSQRRLSQAFTISAPASTTPAPAWNEYSGRRAFTSV